MTYHDPRLVAEDLRNHLAMHDKKLCFLFGAGTSCSVNIAPNPKPGEKKQYIPLIPAIEGLSATCKKEINRLGEEYSNAWDLLSQQCEEGNILVNVENILSKVRIKISAIGPNEKLVGLEKNSLITFEQTVCKTIAKVVNPDIPEFTPHLEFASWIRKVHRNAPIEVFTTNYDMLLETAFEAERVPVFDGFVGTNKPFFYPECLDDESLLPKANWVRMWKLHGSVNWITDLIGSKERIIRTLPSTSGELILPSESKYDESRKQPYSSYMDRLAKILNTEHSILIICGYSFGDQHINSILYGALLNNKTTNIISLQYETLDKTGDLAKKAISHPNLTLIAPNGGVIAGAWGDWRLIQPVDEKTFTFMDSAFDSNAQPEESSAASNQENLSGEMRLGDFNWFCRFLNAMGLSSS